MEKYVISRHLSGHCRSLEQLRASPEHSGGEVCKFNSRIPGGVLAPEQGRSGTSSMDSPLKQVFKRTSHCWNITPACEQSLPQSPNPPLPPATRNPLARGQSVGLFHLSQPRAGAKHGHGRLLLPRTVSQPGVPCRHSRLPSILPSPAVTTGSRWNAFPLVCLYRQRQVCRWAQESQPGGQRGGESGPSRPRLLGLGTAASILTR